MGARGRVRDYALRSCSLLFSAACCTSTKLRLRLRLWFGARLALLVRDRSGRRCAQRWRTRWTRRTTRGSTSSGCGSCWRPKCSSAASSPRSAAASARPSRAPHATARSSSPRRARTLSPPTPTPTPTPHLPPVSGLRDVLYVRGVSSTRTGSRRTRKVLIRQLAVGYVSPTGRARSYLCIWAFVFLTIYNSHSSVLYTVYSTVHTVL